MSLHGAFDDCQANAGTLKAIGRVEPLEYLKELVRISRIEADAVVSNLIGHTRRSFGTRHRDVSRLAFTRELHRIGDQVLEDEADEFGITRAVGKVIPDKTHIARAEVCDQILKD